MPPEQSNVDGSRASVPAVPQGRQDAEIKCSAEARLLSIHRHRRMVNPTRRIYWSSNMTTQRNDMYQNTIRNALACTVVGLLMLAATAANAQQGTLTQRNACKPDVFRLCSNFIPDPTAITNCLERNRANLSQACHAVFSPSTR